MGYVTVGQENTTPIELYYEDHGSGQPVVLMGTGELGRGRPFAKAVPRAEFVEVDGAPHGLIWTHADEVNKVLLDFVSR